MAAERVLAARFGSTVAIVLLLVGLQLVPPGATLQRVEAQQPTPRTARIPPGGIEVFAVFAPWSPSRPGMLTIGPPPVPGMVTVENLGAHPADASFDGRAELILTTPPGTVMQALTRECAAAAERHVLRCHTTGSPPALVRFTTADSPLREAVLDVAGGSPCVPEQEQRVCSAQRRALWQGEAAAWAARGVTDPDARFTETVLLRAQAGDPFTISTIARLLGWPYLQISAVRFVGLEPGQVDEFVEIRNLGFGAQEMTGWTLRSPDRGAVFHFPAGLVLEPLRGCRVYTGVVRPDSCGGASFASTDVWPDERGRVVLYYDALALPGVATRYSADPDDQPPPPYLQLVAPID